jgi:RraA family protein
MTAAGVRSKKIIKKEDMAALPLATAEVCDANPHLIMNGELRALQPIFQIYGRCQVFAGPIVTLKV